MILGLSLRTKGGTRSFQTASKIVDRLQKYVYKEGVSKKPLGVFKECYSGNYVRRNLSAVYGDVYTDFNKLWKDWSNSEEYHPTSTEERHFKQKEMLLRFSRSLPRNLFVPTMHGPHN